MSAEYGQIDLKQWMGNGGDGLKRFEHGTDPVAVLKTFFLLTPAAIPTGDLPLMDPATKDDPEGTVYVKCSASLLARVILTIEDERRNRA